MCVVDPLLALIVTVRVPVRVPLAAVNFTVEVPEPGAEMVEGLKLTVTPEGWPVAVKATAALKPPDMVVVTVVEALLPRLTLTEVGEVETAKLGGTFTVRLMFVVWVIPAPVPLIVMGKVPVVAVELAVSVTVTLPEPGALIEVLLKLTVTPEG